MQTNRAVSRLTALAGTGAVCLLIVTSLARAFGAAAGLAPAIAAAMAVLIAAGFRRIPARLRGTCLVLVLIGCVVLPFARAPLAALRQGLSIAGMLVSLTASVMLVAHCAMHDRRIQRLGAGLRATGGMRRTAAFTVASQFLSGILGLAGANLMFVMAAPHDQPEHDAAERADLVVAIMRGFAAASCWSPVFGQMAVLLALYPGLHWGQVFPVGLALAQFALAVSLAMAWFAGRGASARGGPAAFPASPTSLADAPLLRSAAPVGSVLLAFLAAILAVSMSLHIVVSAAITLLAPAVSWLYHAAAGARGSRVRDGWRGLAAGMQRFPALASEALLFVAATCSGSLMAAAFPLAQVAVLGAKLSLFPFAGLAFLLLSILLAALAGIHPVLTSVFLASTFTPAVLALPPLAHMAAILAGWGLSVSVAPFSVLSLTASHYSGVGLYEISIGRNWAFAAVNAVLVCLLLSAYCLVAY